MQNRIVEFAKKVESLRGRLQDCVNLGDKMSLALESKTQNFFEGNPNLDPEILDKIQAQYSKFMFALLVIASDSPVMQKMSNTLVKMKQMFRDPLKCRNIDWMALRRKLYQYDKKTTLFEEAMIELIREYETLAQIPETQLPSILESISETLRAKILLS